MGVAAEAKKVEAKDLPILQLDKKEYSPPSTRNSTSADRARSLIILQTPIKNVQELAKEEGEESEAKLRGAMRYQRGLSPPLQAAGETPLGRLLRSIDIRF